MSSLAERLRVRSANKPVYNEDDSEEEDDLLHGKFKDDLEKHEKIERPDAMENSCRVCGGSDNLGDCQTCTYAYHAKCLRPPLRAPFPSTWSCPECVNPLNSVKILDCEMRPNIAGDASKMGSKQISVKHYLVKWEGFSYLHRTWVPETEFLETSGLKTKVRNFERSMSASKNSKDVKTKFQPEWCLVDRVIACRESGDEKEYLVKWKDLEYDECYWEFQSEISSFKTEIDNFHQRQSRKRELASNKQKSSLRGDTDSRKKQYDKTPEFLDGGSLHQYQLEGLNFLRSSWSEQTHVILADEMGLGKTVQSIAYLASLSEDYIAPHLVVAPLSTLPNWEREFAKWAPHMNVVTYVGDSDARSFIRDHEFYFPEEHKESEHTKSSHGTSKRKQDGIIFDVLLTSYEMIMSDSDVLKLIKWECMIVDEGHHLHKENSILVKALKKCKSKHRTLLTGTPLQNELDELFMLMRFLDKRKFGSLKDLQEEFKDISKTEQISGLHNMLAPHMLRRMKKDVIRLPPKAELIVRVELSSKQKECYKAVLDKNYEILADSKGHKKSLNNAVMEMRKICCHPFVFNGRPEAANEYFKQLLETSGKLQLLDRMMLKLKERGHRVLVFTQFQDMLNVLEDYCNYRAWQYERIDGNVKGKDRQIRIDRFNNNSSRFCFLLSTRAGGLGINLQTADTVIIYDSDWNPQVDMQAIARAHRLGQTNKVMIYRLITRGTVEEKMMQITKKKMVLEHLVVGKLKDDINQDELDDILEYGSKDLFEDDNDEKAKSHRIHYDDATIDRFLDRSQVLEEDGFLKGFKVAGYEYIVDEQARLAEEAQVAENKATVNNPETASHWEESLENIPMRTFDVNSLSTEERKSLQNDLQAELEQVKSLIERRIDNPDSGVAPSLEEGTVEATVVPRGLVVQRMLRSKSMKGKLKGG